LKDSSWLEWNAIMNRERLSRILRGIRNPSRSVAHIQCPLENFGDILVGQAVEDLLGGLNLIRLMPSRGVRALDSAVGLRRLTRYCCLGGGTLIFSPRGRWGWLDALEYISARTQPLCVIGTGVLDPRFSRGTYLPTSEPPPAPAEHHEAWIACLKRFPFVSVRGVESRRTLAEYGFPDAEIVGDPALYYARTTLEDRPAPSRRIGLNLSGYSSFFGNSQETTVRTLTDVVRRLDREGWTITLIPTIPDDHRDAVEVARQVGSSRIEVVADYLNRRKVFDAIAAQDLFVGVKLHTVIAACCVQTPAIMIAYQPKGIDFMRTMDLEAQLIRSDELDVDRLMALIQATLADSERIRRHEFDQCQEFRNRLLGFRDRVYRSVGVEPPAALAE
jgi:hypothetical protein